MITQDIVFQTKTTNLNGFLTDETFFITFR